MNTLLVMSVAGYVVLRRQRVREFVLRILFDERIILAVAAFLFITMLLKGQLRQEMRRYTWIHDRLKKFHEDRCETATIVFATPIIIGYFIWWDLRRRRNARR